jgi:hypothetical protein
MHRQNTKESQHGAHLEHQPSDHDSRIGSIANNLPRPGYSIRRKGRSMFRELVGRHED